MATRYCGSCISVWIRFFATWFVVKMRIESPQRKITSSRQSPRMSALSVGLLFVPLFAAHPFAVKPSPSPSYCWTLLLSRSSRLRSASHQMRKLDDEGRLPAAPPSEPRKSWLLLTHASLPGLRGSMSAATPRPGPSSPPLPGPFQITSHVRASRIAYAGDSPPSYGMNTSRPGRDGM
ncbi:hypothetical protein BE20_39760 [Sorangium cellulosum]|nr:hypothetical protein BE20_39760 [Sorangium cellulosum]